MQPPINLTLTSGGTKTYPFDNYVIKSTLKVVKTDSTLAGGSVSSYRGTDVTTLNGVEVCKGVEYRTKVITQEWAALAPGIGIQVDGYWIAVPSTIDIRISGTTYEAPSNAPAEYPEPDEIDPVIDAEINYEEQQFLVDAGFNLKCIDEYHKIYLGYGELRADENIINPIIPDREAAIRVGKYYIFKTGKTEKTITQNIVPNLSIEPLNTAYIDLSINFISQIVQIDKVVYNIKEQTMGISYVKIDRES